MKINEAFYHLHGKDNFVLKNHTHNEIEFIEVVSGNGTVLKNDKTYPLKSRYIYVIDARNAHIIYPQPEDCKDYIRNKIVIDADEFLRCFETLGLGNTVSELFALPPISTAQAPEVELLFKQINKIFSTNSETDVSFAFGYVTQLVYWIYNNQGENTLKKGNTTIQKMLNIIAQKQGVTTLSEISKTLHMDKYYLCHLFKAETGRTLTDYLADKLFEKSVKMLFETDETIEKIAFSCGFSSASSFTRFFKSKSGNSPLKFRKDKFKQNNYINGDFDMV